jgi:hypothetical protein
MTYNIYPIVQNEPKFPLTREPVPLKIALQVIEQRMELLVAQGYWRDSRCQQVPIDQIGFTITPDNEPQD